VDVEDLAPGVRRDVAERRERTQNAGIGDEDVELAPALQDGGAEGVKLVGALEVELDERRAAPCGADLVIELLEAADGARKKHGMRPGPGEAEPHRPADAARGAGDEGNAAGERLLGGHAGGSVGLSGRRMPATDSGSLTPPPRQPRAGRSEVERRR